MTRNVRIGLTLLAAIVVAYVVTAWARGTGPWVGQTKEYHIQFGNVNGLKTSDPVLIQGLEVGQVESIQGRDTFVDVTIKLNSKKTIYTDAWAEIQVKELLGGKQIVLDAGKSGKPIEMDIAIRGKPTYDLTTALAHFGPLLETLDQKQLQRILTNLDSLAGRVASLSMQVRPSQINQAASDVTHIFAETNKAVTKLNAMHTVEKTDSLIGRLHLTLANADSSLGVFTHVATHADMHLNQMSSKLSATLQDMRGLLAELKKAKSPAGKILYDTSFTKQMNYTLENLNKTLELIRADQLRVGVKLGGGKTRKP